MAQLNIPPDGGAKSRQVGGGTILGSVANHPYSPWSVSLVLWPNLACVIQNTLERARIYCLNQPSQYSKQTTPLKKDYSFYKDLFITLLTSNLFITLVSAWGKCF